MYFSLIHAFNSDEQGVFDEEADLFAEVGVLDLVTADNLTEIQSLMDTLEEIPYGTHVTFEVFVMKYMHFVDTDDEESVQALFQTLMDEVGDMLDDESLILLEDFEVTFKVAEPSIE